MNINEIKHWHWVFYVKNDCFGCGNGIVVMFKQRRDGMVDAAHNNRQIENC